MIKPLAFACTLSLFLLLILSCSGDPALHSLNRGEWSYVSESGEGSLKPEQLADLMPLIPGNSGFITLRCNFDYESEDLSALYLGRVSIASEAYLNGQKIGSTGAFPPHWYNDWNKPYSFTLPARLLNSSGKQELTLKLYCHSEGLIRNEILIGPYESVFRHWKATEFWFVTVNMVISFIFIAFALYNVTIYLQNRRERPVFWFSLLTASFALNHLSLFYTNLPGFSYEPMAYLLTTKLFLIMEWLVVFCAIKYSEHQSRLFHWKKYRTVLLAVTLVLLQLAVIQNSYHNYKRIMGYFEISLILPLGYSLVLIMKSHGKKFLLLALPALLSILHDLTLPHIISGYSLYLAGLGVPVLLMMVNFLLARDFARDRYRVKELNETLEKKVEERSALLMEAEKKIAIYSQKQGIIGQYDLSKREREILGLILDGSTNDEISEKLNISIRTVNTHVYNIYKKLNVHSRMEIFALLTDSKD